MTDRASPTPTPAKRSQSGSQKRQRGKRLQLCLTDAEAQEIETRAERAGLSVSGYLRALAFGKDTPQPPAAKRPPVEKQILGRLLGELGKIGSNINQIARRVNEGKGFDLEPFATAYAELRRLNNALLEALGKEPNPAEPDSRKGEELKNDRQR